MSKIVQALGSFGVGLSFFGYLIGYVYYGEVIRQMFNISTPVTYYFSWDFLLVRGIVIMTSFLFNAVVCAMLMYYLVGELLNGRNTFRISRWLYYVSVGFIIALNYFVDMTHWNNYPNLIMRIVWFLSLIFLYAFLTLAIHGNHDYMKEVGSSYFTLALIGTMIFFFSFVSVSIGKFHVATIVDKNGRYDYPRIAVEYKNSSTKSDIKLKEYYLFSKANDCLFLFEQNDLHLRCLPLAEISLWYSIPVDQKISTKQYKAY